MPRKATGQIITLDKGNWKQAHAGLGVRAYTLRVRRKGLPPSHGVQRTLLQVPGGMNGTKGIYEYILNPLQQVVHQRFIPGGIITGTPNQVVP